MPISHMLLPEFDHEMANTRKTLERIPEDQLGWKPHQKSMPLDRLAGHLAELPGFGSMIIQTDFLDLSAGEHKPTVAISQKQVVEVFDQKVKDTRAAIEGASDENLMQPWKLIYNGQTLFEGPRVGVIRGMMMNHVIHHRAQLGVYLRLTGVPVPSIYGPSADEGNM